MAGVNKVACLIAGSMLALIPTSASAITAEGRYNAQGYGTKSCGAYTEARKVHESLEVAVYTTWLTGFITAMNHEISDTYNLAGSTDVEGLMGWLDNWCRQHPTETSRLPPTPSRNFFIRREPECRSD
jgi:hypothetical protein